MKKNNFTLAQRMLDAAICAYSVESDGSFDPDSEYLDPIDLEGSPATFDGGKHEIDAGFVGTTKADKVTGDKWVVLSFRGTLSTLELDNWDSILAFIDDWFQDDETRMTAMSVGNTFIGNVEKGFNDAMQHVWPLIAAELDKVDWNSVSGIQITGHSKGAAMTFLAAAMVKINYPAARSINVHAYAAPLAGDPTFASWYNSNHLGTTTTRYQRLRDIVPFLPPSVNWDIFDNLPGTWHPEGLLIEGALKVASLQVHGGYQEVGSLVGLVTENPDTSQMINHADEVLRKGIQHAIYLGDGKAIAQAHSAIDSYRPALFPSE